ncbi:DUF4830 domain-containing protein [Candidatus Soleaferrea massiliensis]|uniref:DUF4830 domain-containing protein n=1 Tax=Candidatus Soleaferrea massiliensis TaxID=1470354 RepID=UPI00069344DE|nr:DUF4830 domain-containing protein [Candidatus Soleaferrea massiliensis]
MFVMSMKMNKKKIVTVILVALAVIVLLWFFVLNGNTSSLPTASIPVNQNVDVPDNTARVSYLKRFGWDISAEPTEVVSAFVPQEFDDVYTNYNAIQLKQGFDLSGYQGKEVVRYTYDVANYPDHPSNVKANLLVAGGKVIAGDICSTELDGFMHELNVTNQTAAGTGSAAQTDAAASDAAQTGAETQTGDGAQANTGVDSPPAEDLNTMGPLSAGEEQQAGANVTVTETSEPVS